MKSIRTLLLLWIFLNSLIVGGCWDLREINELGLVTAVGVDKGDGPNKYSVTVQIANPSSEGAGDSKGGENNKVWTGTEQGSSLFDAVRKLSNVSSRRIMWAHNNVVIIGESLAKEGIIPIVDFFTHNPELRLKAAVVVARGDAKEYIAAPIGMESPSGISFIKLEGYRALTAETVESHMLNVSSSLENKYGNPLIAGITRKNEPGMSGEAGKSPGILEMSGAAVFEKDKMLGWLSPEECRGVSWILNQTKNTLVTVTDPEYGDKNVTVETKGVKAKIKTEVVNGAPKISVTISGRGDIVEEDGSTDQDMRKVKKNIAGLVNHKIEEETRHGLEAVQKKYRVDVLGFAAIVHVQNNGEWESGLKDKWKEVFPEIPVSVSVDIDIKSSALYQEPMNID